MNGVDIGDQLRANSYNSGRCIRRGGWQALCHLFLLEVSVINCFLLQRHGYTGPQRESHVFRRQLYVEIFKKFSRAMAATKTPTTAPTMVPTAAPTHIKIRRQKRSWCAYCSSRKRNVILNVKKAGPSRQKHFIHFGCDICCVPL